MESEGFRAQLFLRAFLVSAALTLGTSLALVSVVAVDFSAQLTWPWNVPWYITALAALCLASILGVAVTSVTALVFEARQERALQAFTRELESLPHDSWPEVEELSGWKIAKVQGPSVHELSFAGIGYGSYGVSELAKCELGQEHDVPSPGCSCGFHAFYSRAQAQREWKSSPECVLLQVEGFGCAVEHERGWRASAQDVLTVWVAQRCSKCHRPSEGLTWSSRWACWVASCAKCSSSAGAEFVSVADLAHSWGTEVRVFDL